MEHADEALEELFEPSAFPDPTPLSDALRDALFGGELSLRSFRSTPPSNRRDAMITLNQIYDLSRGPVSVLDGQARYAGHPVVTTLRWQLEEAWLKDLEQVEPEPSDDPVVTLAALAVRPSPAHQRLTTSSWSDAVALLNSELTLTRTFDVLPRRLEDAIDRPIPVPTHDHARLIAALSIQDLPTQSRTTAELELAALAGLFTLNHWLAPEALGALTLHQLLRARRHPDERTALEALGAPVQAFDDAAEVPSLLTEVLEPTLSDRPDWSTRVLRGALWYSRLDDRLHA